MVGDLDDDSDEDDGVRDSEAMMQSLDRRPACPLVLLSSGWWRPLKNCNQIDGGP